MLLRPDDMMGVTIRPQGNSKGHSSSAGFENQVITQNLAETQLSELIAGHVAERVVFGEYTLGASADLQEAAGKIRYLITCCGIYGYKYLGHGGQMRMMQSSEAVIAEIDKLTEDILNRIDASVEVLIKGNRKLFDAIVDALLTKQSLCKEELEQILSDYQACNAA
jgi:cell division protease FtsH